jgi:hypothetical protein
MSDSLAAWVVRHRTAVVALVAIVLAAALASAAATRSSSTAIPASAGQRLRATALRVATADGDPKPASIIAVRTTFARAMAAVGGGDRVPGNPGEAVYVVLMKGDFTANDASTPSGGRAPTGHYWSAIYDAGTFAGIEAGLTARPPAVSLQTLGPVSDLT